MDKYLILLIVTFGLCYSNIARSQYCVNQYSQARELYDQGKVDSVMIHLRPCLSDRHQLSRAPKNIQAEIFKLAGNASILLDNPDSAQFYINKFLAERPFYAESPDPNDIIGFKASIDSTRAFPSWLAGIKVGPNLTIVQIDRRFSILEFDGPTRERDYTTNFLHVDNFREVLAFQLGLIVEKVLWSKQTSISVEPTFGKHRFEYSVSYPELDDLSFDLTQKITYFEIPTVAKYKFWPTRKFRPYVEGGLFARFLLTANKDVSSTSNPSSSSNTPPITRSTPETPITDLMAEFYMGWTIGMGVNWNLNAPGTKVIKNSSFGLNMRYKSSFARANNRSRRFLNNDLSDVFLYEFYDVLDDTRLKSLHFSLTWTYHLDYKVFKR